MDSTTVSKKRGKPVAVILIVVLLALVVILDMRRRDAEKKLMEYSLNGGQQVQNQEQNREAARLIVEKVRRLYTIPEGVEPTVATIVDVEQLRAKNAFYNKAKNGDHLIVTSDRAILYDPAADKIIDVVPVQIQPTAADESASASSAAKK